MVFTALAEQIEAALEHSAQHQWTLGELARRCAEGEFRMLASFEPGAGPESILGCVVLSRNQRDDGRVTLAVVCCAGRCMEQWIDQAVEAGFEMARREGADEVVILGRPGWLRQLAKHGLRLRAVIAAAAVPELATTH
jgi:hypothetical protein